MNAIVKDDFATQAGHWYDAKTGEPRYTYTNAKGGISNTTVREARKHGYVPSVTTILRQAAAPRLTEYFKAMERKAAIRKSVQAAILMAAGGRSAEEIIAELESDSAFNAAISKDAAEHASTARDRGTEIHGAIEKQDLSGPWAGHVSAAIGALDGWVGETLEWASERSFASHLGFGGKLDVSAPGYVADYKTSDKPLDGLKLWPEHRRQLAAYRMGLDMPEARCAIVYVSAVKPEARVIELSEDELKQGWAEFRSLLSFYYAMNRMELPRNE